MDAPFDPEAGSYQTLDIPLFLAQCALFSGLSPWELKSIGQLMRIVEYRKGQTIYEEGGPGNAFYVIISGRFEAFAASHHKKRVLAYLKRGDYFGEMSLLTDQPHSATLRALSDSLILELKKEDFKRIVEHNATLSLELSRRLSTRLKVSDGHTKTPARSDIISIYNQYVKASRAAFSMNLAASLLNETHQKTILVQVVPPGSEEDGGEVLSSFQEIESKPAEAFSKLLIGHRGGFDLLKLRLTEQNGSARKILVALLNHLAIDYRFVLVDLPPLINETFFTILGQSDWIYFTTDNGVVSITETKQLLTDLEKRLTMPDDKIGIVIHEVLLGLRTTAATKRELFGSKACYSLPETGELAEKDPTGIPIVMDEPEAEYTRVVRHIARRISDNLVGLALGSGAAFGLAHIGVLKVLEKEKIPIDVVAGSSIGALIGAFFALGKDAEEIEKATTEDIDGWFRLFRLVDFCLFPIRGIVHGDCIKRRLKHRLGSKTFEDCQTTFKITGANLSTRQPVVFESGLLYEAVRASIAIPAIFKPIFMGEDCIVDGGILDPLPIQALQAAGASKIIAVNVFPTHKELLEKRILLKEAAEKERIRVRQKGLLSRTLYRLKKLFAKCFSYNIFDILMSTIQMMEASIAEIEAESADIVLRPVLPDANWAELYKPSKFIRRGEEEALKQLPKIKALVSQQGS